MPTSAPPIGSEEIVDESALGVRFEAHLTEPVTDQVDRKELVGA